MEEIAGLIRRIIYTNEENGWTVLELTDDSGEEITAVGIMPLCAPGERVILTGGYVEHKDYGRQFKAQSCASLAPASLDALETYLGSGLIKGVGAALAKSIVSHFQMDTLQVLEHTPERLAQISGIGKRRASEIAASFASQRAMRDSIMRLQGYGIPIRQAMKLYQLYGPTCVQVVEDTPYRLIEDVEGIGFKTADSIARHTGIEPTSRARLRAGLMYLLLWARQEGHTYLPRERLLDAGVDLLQVPKESIEETLFAMLLDGALTTSSIEEIEAVYLPALAYMERDCARMLLKLAQPQIYEAPLDLAQALCMLERQLQIELAPAQREAVLCALREYAMVITGGPGTGKTTILQFVLHLMEQLGLDFALCAPTGRAAKRMTEATGFEASTIHRLLEYGGEGQPRFARNKDNPLYMDMVVVDEMSMVDLPLFHALLEALPRGTRLIMVGDADQLPPVGAGTVLHDIIKSNTIKLVRLTALFRQAGRSGIAQNAHRINAGEPPVYDADGDFMLLPCTAAPPALEQVLSICTGAYGGIQDPWKDVQVLSPTKKGPLSVKALNARLQAALNPPAPEKAERAHGETMFREGDKVMQVKNNYRLEWAKPGPNGTLALGSGVYNGDLGTLLRIQSEEQTLQVLFDDARLADYSFSQLEELELAYCISIHKSQGSEFPVVVLPLISGPPMLMTRNLLYTAVTRARAQVILVGREGTILQMVQNKQTRKRYSGLSLRLEELATLFFTKEGA